MEAPCGHQHGYCCLSPKHQGPTGDGQIVQYYSQYSLKTTREHYKAAKAKFDCYDVNNNAATCDFLLDLLELKLHDMVSKKLEDDDGFLVTWLQPIKSIQMTNIKHYKSLKEQVKACHPSQFPGQSMTTLASTLHVYAHELDNAYAYDHNLTLTMLETFLLAGGDDNEDYKVDLHIKKKELKKELKIVCHMGYNEVKEHMMKQDLTYKSICEVTENAYSEQANCSKWPLAWNIHRDSAAPPASLQAMLLPTGHTLALRSMPCFKPRWALSQLAPSPETATDVANLDTGQENVPTRAKWIPMWTTATTVVTMVAVDAAMAVHVVAMSMLAAVATPMTMVRNNITLKTGSMLLLLQASLSARLPTELHLSGVASENIGQQATTLTCMASSMKPTSALSLIHWFGALESSQHCLSMTCGPSWVPRSWASSAALWQAASGPTLLRLHPSSRHGSGPWHQSCGWPSCSPSSSIAPLKSPPLIIKSATTMPSNAIATLAIPSIMLEVSEIMVSITSTLSIYAPCVSMSTTRHPPTFNRPSCCSWRCSALKSFASSNVLKTKDMLQFDLVERVVSGAMTWSLPGAHHLENVLLLVQHMKNFLRGQLWSLNIQWLDFWLCAIFLHMLWMCK